MVRSFMERIKCDMHTVCSFIQLTVKIMWNSQEMSKFVTQPYGMHMQGLTKDDI